MRFQCIIIKLQNIYIALSCNHIVKLQPIQFNSCAVLEWLKTLCQDCPFCLEPEACILFACSSYIHAVFRQATGCVHNSVVTWVSGSIIWTDKAGPLLAVRLKLFAVFVSAAVLSAATKLQNCKGCILVDFISVVQHWGFDIKTGLIRVSIFVVAPGWDLSVNKNILIHSCLSCYISQRTS